MFLLTPNDILSAVLRIDWTWIHPMLARLARVVAADAGALRFLRMAGTYSNFLIQSQTNVMALLSAGYTYLSLEF